MQMISNPTHTQYMMRYFHFAFWSPIGFTKVEKKPAPRPKNWKTEIPRDRTANGKSSTR